MLNFFLSQQQHVVASDETTHLANIYSEASEGLLLCVLMNKTRCLSFLFNIKSPWTVTGTMGEYLLVLGHQGDGLSAGGLCSFLKLPPCDMFRGECSYLLSTPVCIALLIVCSHVPQCASRETDRSREALMLWSNVGLRLQSPGGQASRCCHYSIRKKRELCSDNDERLL